MPRVLLRNRLEPPETGPPFYVSPDGQDTNAGTESAPFRTLGAARAAVQALTSSMAGHLTVYLRGGTYPLSATEAFTPADSGQNGFSVIWRAYPGETPVISGGVPITGWTDQGGGLWRAPTSLSFRQLYVNGVRATRARYPKAGSYGTLVFWNIGGQEVQLEAAHADEAANAQELVIIGHGVNSATLRIASVSDDVVVPHATERGRLFTQTYPPKGPGNTYYLQGGLNLCTAQGEWHLDTVNEFVYYRPLGGENMATATVIAPQIERLVSLIGTNATTTIHDLQFHGITFAYATWLLPNTEGFVGDQGPTYFLTTLPADEITSYPSGRMACAVYVYDADDIRFERCVFRDCGADGLHFYRGVRDAQIVGCVGYGLSGGAFAVDLALLGNTATSTVPCRRITIANNYVEHYALEFHQSYGIMTGYVDEPLIEYNEVTDGPYVGIGLGWGWSYETNTMASAIVRRNKVWNVCHLERDSAGIYTLSDQNGALIEHNYVSGIVRNAQTTGGFNISDIYLDEGSGDLTVQNNVCTGEADTFVFQNANGSNVSLSNNDASDPGGVISGAGLEAGYADIRERVP